MRWIPDAKIDIDLASAFFESAGLSEEHAKVIVQSFTARTHTEIAQNSELSREEIAALLQDVGELFGVEKVKGGANPLRQLLSKALREGLSVKIDHDTAKVAVSLAPKDQLFLAKVAQGYSNDDVKVSHQNFRSDHQFNEKIKELKGKFHTSSMEHAALLCVSGLAAHDYAKIVEWFPNLEAQTADL